MWRIMYVYNIVSLSLLLISLLLCVKFSFAKRAYVWVSCTAVTLALGFHNTAVFLTMLAEATPHEIAMYAESQSVILCAVSSLWLLCIIAVRARTNKIRRKEIERMQKIYEEAYIKRFTELRKDGLQHLPPADLSDEQL